MSSLKLSDVVKKAQSAPAPTFMSNGDTRIEMYTGACRRLIAAITDWLQPEIISGAVQILETEQLKRITEQGFTYDVPTLRFRVGPRTVAVEPRGIWVIGAYGRADLVSEPGAPVILTLSENYVWEVPKVGVRKVNYVSLDQSTFPEALSRALTIS